MTRLCRIDDCHKPARHQRHLCDMHRERIRRYGDPHHNTWTVADLYDVEIIARERRPATGLTRLEQRLVARRLTAAKVSAAEIARIVGTTSRTVCRWRAKNRNTTATLEVAA